MQEATIVRWLKNEGDVVAEGEELVEIETDKVNVAVESPVSGVLAKQCAAVDEVVVVGNVIAVIEETT